MKLKDLKKDDIFSRKPLNNKEVLAFQVYIKGEYDHSSKRYWCQKWDDISKGMELKGDTEVYQDFIF